MHDCTLVIMHLFCSGTKGKLTDFQITWVVSEIFIKVEAATHQGKILATQSLLSVDEQTPQTA